MTEIAPEHASWKPAADRFSIAEVIAHLGHSERNCYRVRLDRFLSEDRPEFEPDDAQMWLDLYRDADARTALDALKQPEVGEITLSHMLHEWALHDLGHIRQIAELVRARKYLSGAGPLGKYYRLTP